MAFRADEFSGRAADESRIKPGDIAHSEVAGFLEQGYWETKPLLPLHLECAHVDTGESVGIAVDDTRVAGEVELLADCGGANAVIMRLFTMIGSTAACAPKSTPMWS